MIIAVTVLLSSVSLHSLRCDKRQFHDVKFGVAVDARRAHAVLPPHGTDII